MAEFRFEDLDIWKKAIKIGDQLYDIADDLENENKYRFAEQLRGSALSVSNNIAEGSGGSDREFERYLNIARSSVYELANMLKLFLIRGYVDETDSNELLDQLDHLSRQITNFKKKL